MRTQLANLSKKTEELKATSSCLDETWESIQFHHIQRNTALECRLEDVRTQPQPVADRQLEEINADLEKTVKSLRAELKELHGGNVSSNKRDSPLEAALEEAAHLRDKNEEQSQELQRLRADRHVQSRKQDELKAEIEWLTKELQEAKDSLKEETGKRIALEQARDGFMAAYAVLSGTRTGPLGKAGDKSHAPSVE